MMFLVHENLPGLNELLSQHGEVQIFHGRRPTDDQLRLADALFIRSGTQVDLPLLQVAAKVCFIGTGTIGTEHVNLPLLHEKNINFASTPGANAVSVGEFVLAAALELARQKQIQLKGKMALIIGSGHTGTEAGKRLAALGMKVFYIDPNPVKPQPKDMQGRWSFLKEADLVSLHVPLTTEGAFATHHLMDATRLAQLKPGAILINSSRGAVIDNQALLQLLQLRFSQAQRLYCALDVWENEPVILTELLPYVSLATAHIAGHSYEGKVNSTIQLYKAAARFFGWQVDMNALSALLPAKSTLFFEADIKKSGKDTEIDETELQKWVESIYQTQLDDQLFRKAACTAAGFDSLRKNYRIRRELSVAKIKAPKAQAERLRRLGFEVELT